MLTGELTPLFHSAEPRRRGRPPGAKAQVVRDARALGIHHFAFVRSSLLGLDCAKPSPVISPEARPPPTCATSRTGGTRCSSKITHLLDLLRSDAPVKAALTLPSHDGRKCPAKPSGMSRWFHKLRI